MSISKIDKTTYDELMKKFKGSIPDVLSELGFEDENIKILIVEGTKKQGKFQWGCQKLNRKNEPHKMGAKFHITKDGRTFYVCSSCYSKLSDTFNENTFSNEVILINSNGINSVEGGERKKKEPAKPKETKKDKKASTEVPSSTEKKKDEEELSEDKSMTHSSEDASNKETQEEIKKREKKEKAKEKRDNAIKQKLEKKNKEKN